MEARIRDLIAAIFFLTLSIIMYILSTEIVELADMGVSSAFAPKLVATGMFILSIILLIQVLISWKKINKKYGQEGKVRDVFLQRKYVNAFFTILLICTYIILIPRIGFLISTIVYLFIQFCLLSDRKNWNIILFIVISVISAFTIYYAFRLGFQVRLPVGVLG